MGFNSCLCGWLIGFSAVELLLCMTLVWKMRAFFDLDLCIPLNFQYTGVENENSCVSVKTEFTLIFFIYLDIW